MNTLKRITSVERLISQVKKDYKEWNTTTYPWFRGERLDTDFPLLPRLYRQEPNKNPKYDELALLQQFRAKAPSLGSSEIPPRGNTDEWLFLAQHSGLPTRLLDWTEGLLVALHFALLEKQPVIWMLDPVELNRRSLKEEDRSAVADNVFPLTWFSPNTAPIAANDLIDATNYLVDSLQTMYETQGQKKSYYQNRLPLNLGAENIRAVWEQDSRRGTTLPMAIRPTYIHRRMNVQRSCFTIQGKRQESLSGMVDDRVLRKYVIQPSKVQSMRSDLRTIGITNATVFPDLDNLAKDLAELFED